MDGLSPGRERGPGRRGSPPTSIVEEVGHPLTTERERIERSHTLNPKLCEAIFTMLTLAEQPVRQHSASLYAKR